MEELIEELTNEYNEGFITWHDIQDIVEGRLMLLAGGYKAYEKIPIRERFTKEDKMLKEIEKRIYEEVD